MGIIRWLINWRDRRHELAQLRDKLIANRERFEREVREKKLTKGSVEYEEALHDYDEADLYVYGRIDAIETRQALSRAFRWRVPVQRRPSGPITNNEYWQFNPVHEEYFLTPEAHRQIRHAVATEMDIRFRPWLSWGAVGISLIALFKP